MLNADKLTVGVEIEVAVPYSYVDMLGLEIGGYHYPIPYNHWWSISSDGSLNIQPYRSGWTTMEFVQAASTGKYQFDNAIESFIDIFPHDEFRLHFNNSMGCHIHFSLDGKFMNFFNYHSAIAVRHRIHDKIAEINPAGLAKFQSQYGRYYALKTENQKDYYSRLRRGERQVEWNLTRGKGMEWRSFNLLGVDSFDMLRDYLYAAWQVLHDVVDEGIHNEFREPVRIGRIGDIMDDEEHREIRRTISPSSQRRDIDLVIYENEQTLIHEQSIII